MFFGRKEVVGPPLAAIFHQMSCTVLLNISFCYPDSRNKETHVQPVDQPNLGGLLYKKKKRVSWRARTALPIIKFVCNKCVVVGFLNTMLCING